MTPRRHPIRTRGRNELAVVLGCRGAAGGWRLAAGGYPSWYAPEHVGDLLDAGIDLFVNLTQDHRGGTDAHMPRYDDDVEGRAEVWRSPIPDLGLPAPGQMPEILNTIDEGLDVGRNVYVHCWGGSGRTGLAIGCWLRRHDLASADVIETLNRLRRHGDLDGGHKPTPNTEDQATLIRSWATGN